MSSYWVYNIIQQVIEHKLLVRFRVNNSIKETILQRLVVEGKSDARFFI